MFSVSPETYQTIHQVSRFLFAFGGILILMAALAFLIAENRAHKEARRANPAAGTVGELVVISGNSELPDQTWFPVIREGVLGSVRSCDVVVPCAGVRPHHLDFIWRDGEGLLIRPRSGCEVWVNDIPLNCKSDPESAPLTHGASLQVGSALLRLHLFAALDHTSVSRMEPDTFPAPAEIYPPVPMQNPAPFGPVPGPVFMPVPPQVQPNPFPPQMMPAPPVASADPYASAPPAVSASPADPPRPRRSDRWKEDWSE